MKKVFLLIVLFILPTSVFALNKDIIALDARANGNTISYNGTIESGAYAVMCKLYNSSNEEVDYFSSSVENDFFEGTLTAPGSGDYKVSCADFDSGNINSVNVSVGDTSTSLLRTSDNPHTNDGILAYVFIFFIGMIGLISGSSYILKHKNK